MPDRWFAQAQASVRTYLKMQRSCRCVEKSMNTKSKLLAAIAAFQLVSAPVFAAGKSYQVTGPVVEINDQAIVVQKGDEKWEIAKSAATKQKGTPKVGDKVTVHYQMNATSIEAKEGGAKKK
jgi:hypothetical protein